MLKRISVQQLTIGMHLQEMCGSWMEHPFWKTSFLLHDQGDIDRILASSIQEVWIDTSKGMDVNADTPALAESESSEQVEEQLRQMAAQTRLTVPNTMADELNRAAMICARSREAVASMFGEARMGNSISQAGAQAMVQEISDSITRNPNALISLARLKTADDYTYMHSVAVCALMIALARQLNLDETQTRSLGVAGLLHDLGKAVMPMEVLNKPGKLTDEEFAIIKSHPLKGHEMLVRSEVVDPVVLDVCMHHHEKVDGSGYPKGFPQAQISLFAKMGAVCDVYDAITSNRPYKMGWDPAESLRKMAEWSKGHFDSDVFQAFVRSLGIYPVGSLVRLDNGMIGVVTEQSAASLLTPIVKVFYSTKSKLRVLPRTLDLSRKGSHEKIVSREDPEVWRFPDLHDLWMSPNP
jgi:putative nucleotidyltransferase with HDIG domain